MSRDLDILCLGEPLVEFNETEPGRWLEGFGGDVSNVAVAAARLGARAGVAARLGTDGFGDALVAMWRAEGVELRAVARDPDAPTGLYFVRHGPAGHAFEYRRAGSAAARATPADLPRAAIGQARLLHLSGISQAISASAAEAGFAAIAAAREAGTLVSYDPNLRLRLWPLDRAREVIHRAMRGVDVALPGLDDAVQLTGLDSPEAICGFYLDLGAKVVALTLGGEGAMVAAPGLRLRLPARPARAVDATGAGDCFDGAFLLRWLETGDPAEAARFAVAAASLAVEGWGAVAPLPRRAAVEAALAPPPASA